MSSEDERTFRSQARYEMAAQALNSVDKRGLATMRSILAECSNNQDSHKKQKGALGDIQSTPVGHNCQDVLPAQTLFSQAGPPQKKLSHQMNQCCQLCWSCQTFIMRLRLSEEKGKKRLFQCYQTLAAFAVDNVGSGADGSIFARVTCI